MEAYQKFRRLVVGEGLQCLCEEEVGLSSFVERDRVLSCHGEEIR